MGAVTTSALSAVRQHALLVGGFILAIILSLYSHIGMGDATNSTNTALREKGLPYPAYVTNEKAYDIGLLEKYIQGKVAPYPVYTPKDTKHLKVAILTFGSRGDIQPFIALCQGLKTRGHECKIVTLEEHRQFVESHDVEFGPVAGETPFFVKFMQTACNHGFASPQWAMATLSPEWRSWYMSFLHTAREQLKGSDVVLSIHWLLAGPHIAESLNLPHIDVLPFPFTPTEDWPTLFSDDLLRPHKKIPQLFYSAVSKLSYKVVDYVGMPYIISLNNEFRKSFDLPVLSLNQALTTYYSSPVLYAFSEHLAAKPKDWPENTHITGLWTLNDKHKKPWAPPASLVSFLEDRSKPIVYIGFGSMILDDPDAVTKKVLDAVKQANVKAVLLRGWSARGLGQVNITDADITRISGGDILPLTEVQHDWLFPRVDVVVHHGGAGTTAAGIKAGKPSVVKPFMGDQFFWATRVEELKLGKYVPKDFKSTDLSSAIIECLNTPEFAINAEKTGRKIAAENGVEVAIDKLELELDILLATRPTLKREGPAFDNGIYHGVFEEGSTLDMDSEEITRVVLGKTSNVDAKFVNALRESVA